MRKLAGIIVAKVKTNYAKLTIILLLQKAHQIYSALLGNSNFPTPQPDLSTFETLIKTLEQADIAASNGDRVAIAARDAAQTKLLNAISAIGNYVNYLGGGQIPVLSTSGFDFFRTGSHQYCNQ